MQSKFDSIKSIVNYLRGPSAGSSKKPSKGRSSSNSSDPEVQPDIQILPKGRVRYGPITVNPRKQPSKTLITGRRSKNEVLPDEEEEKRRDRRERNRVAATKCREKRETVLSHLEKEHRQEMEKNLQLTKLVENLSEQKQNLETILTNHVNECSLLNNSLSSMGTSSMIFGDPSFLATINETPVLPLPLIQGDSLYNEEEELSHILDSPCLLTNSDYQTDDSSSHGFAHQLPLAPVPPHSSFTLTSRSLEQILNGLKTPTTSMDNNAPVLCNSAQGASCAKQFSSSSEDDSMSSTHANQYVC